MSNNNNAGSTETLAVIAAEEKAMSRLLELAIQPLPMKTYLQQGIQMVIDQVPYLKLLPKGGVFLSSSNPLEKKLLLIASYNFPAEMLSLCAQVDYGHCLCGRAAESGQIQYACCIDDRHDIHFNTMEPHGHFNVPIVHEHGVLGVLVLYLPNGHEKTDREIAFLQRVANVFSLGITHRQMLQELEAAKIRAENGSLVKSQFLTKVSQQLRTPLNGIMGLSRALETTPLDDEQQEIVNALRINGKSFHSLINEFMDFSAIHSGNLNVREFVFSMQDVVTNVQRQLAANAEQKEIHLQFSIDDSIPAILQGDPTLLERILINLGGNAIKYSDPGKQVDFKVRVKQQKNDSSCLVFSVCDQGIGMTRDFQQRLFIPFNQAQSDLNMHDAGLGIGLMICKEFVELLGGEIWVDSEYGRGSKFYFSACLNTDDTLAQ